MKLVQTLSRVARGQHGKRSVLFPLFTLARSQTCSLVSPHSEYGGIRKTEHFASLVHFFFFTSFFVFHVADLPPSPGVVYYHLLLRPETRIPGVAPFSFRIGIWDFSVHRGQKSYTPTAFGKLWTTPGVRCMKHASS